MNDSRTYKLEQSPVPPESWSDYAARNMAKWKTLLNRDPSPSESEVQQFLEMHPSLVPGAFGTNANPSGGPIYKAVITQAPLPSYNKRVTDFMWISRDSMNERPVLIEIEAPSKKYFTKDGVPTAEFTQAQNQIAEWKAYFNDLNNVELFKKFYGIERYSGLGLRFSPSYILIYGRRSEFEGNKDLTAKRGILNLPDVHLISFDSLNFDPKCDQFICVKMRGPLRPEAISVPATIAWSPILASDRCMISNIEQAVLSNSEINHERKHFLASRVGYWNEWGKRDDQGFINAGDKE